MDRLKNRRALWVIALCALALAHRLRSRVGTPAFEVEASDAHIGIANSLFGWVRSLRVVPGHGVYLFGDQDLATYAGVLCPAGLRAAQLCSPAVQRPSTEFPKFRSHTHTRRDRS